MQQQCHLPCRKACCQKIREKFSSSVDICRNTLLSKGRGRVLRKWAQPKKPHFSHKVWLAATKPEESVKIRLNPSKFRKAPDTFNFLKHAMRAILSVRPKCSHRCVSLKKSQYIILQNRQAHNQKLRVGSWQNGFFADFILAGLFFWIFRRILIHSLVGKSAPENPLGKVPCKILQIYATEIPGHISAEGSPKRVEFKGGNRHDRNRHNRQNRQNRHGCLLALCVPQNRQNRQKLS